MQKISQYAINGNAGAFTKIRCTLGSTHRMSIVEDGSANAGVQQGLQYQLATNIGGDITYGPTVQVPPNLSLEPIVIEGNPADHAPHKEPIGTGGSAPYPVGPGGPVTHGTIVAQFKSFSGNATTINVTEWD
jgi:hypothetical protein